MGEWYAIVYTDVKAKQNLCIGRATKRFLEETGGKVTHLELDCLKPHVGNSNIMDEYPEDQNDLFNFNVSDVFFGPIYSYRTTT